MRRRESFSLYFQVKSAISSFVDSARDVFFGPMKVAKVSQSFPNISLKVTAFFLFSL